MTVSEIPLAPGNQQFAVTMGSAAYTITLVWRGATWVMDLDAQDQTPLVHGIPFTAEHDLLEQHKHLGIPASLIVLTDEDQPTYAGLGTATRLYAVTA